MGCTGCSSGGSCSGGCKGNGGCGTYGSNRLEVFDWMAGIQLPEHQKPYDVVEIRFKNNRKGFYRSNADLELYVGDAVTVDVSPGYDVGVVSLTGELVKNQMKRKNVKDNYEIKKVLHKSTDSEISKWQEVRKLEHTTMIRARIIAKSLSLQMKISDVEYQGDKTKATFYYTADDRVDFRELIRKFAEEFRVKIEMRQIGYRQEAAKLGGISSSGRELCSSSWMTDFRAVSTSAARYQQLSLNPAKLAGQCGKLKCCLNFELDQYVEALKEFPSVHTRLKLPKGDAVHFKTDVFKKLMYFVYEGLSGEAPFPLHVEAIKEIIEQNKKGIVIEDLDEFLEEEETSEDTDFAQVVGQDSLTRFDKRRSRKNRKHKRSFDTKGAKGDAPKPRTNRPPRPAEAKDEKKAPANQGSQAAKQNVNRKKSKPFNRPNQKRDRQSPGGNADRKPGQAKNPGDGSTSNPKES